MLIIDRFEEDKAVIEFAGTTFILPKKALPKNSKEGDLLKIIIDEKETEKRKEKIKKMADELFE